MITVSSLLIMYSICETFCRARLVFPAASTRGKECSELCVAEFCLASLCQPTFHSFALLSPFHRHCLPEECASHSIVIVTQRLFFFLLGKAGKTIAHRGRDDACV
jgi:hypothetical protein